MDVNFTSPPDDHTIRLYIFGDSLSDSGNVASLVSHLTTTSVFCNGRYGDGPVWHDYLEHTLNGKHHTEVHNPEGCEHVRMSVKGKPDSRVKDESRNATTKENSENVLKSDARSTSKGDLTDSAEHTVAAFAVRDSMVNRFGNNPGGSKDKYEHVSETEWEHIIEDDIESNGILDEPECDISNGMKILDILEKNRDEQQCKYTVKIHNYAHGGSTTCNDALQGFATEFFVPVPGVCQVLSALPTVVPSETHGKAHKTGDSHHIEKLTANPSDMSTGDKRVLNSRETVVASLWIGTNDMYWSLHQNSTHPVDFIAIARRTVKTVEDLLRKGFNTVLVGQLIDPAYMPGFQYFRLSTEQFRALEEGYREYVVELQEGLERVKTRLDQEGLKDILFWNPQHIMEQHISTSKHDPSSNLDPSQTHSQGNHPHTATEIDQIICTRAECLFVTDGFHPKSSTQSLFGRHVSALLKQRILSRLR